MSDLRSSIEFQKYLYGVISKKEAEQRYYNRMRKEQEKFNKCMAEYGPAFVCLPCAETYYEGEERKGERNVCAASLSCMFYGGLTTITSSTCWKSSIGLSFGIPVLVIGTLCGMGMCAREIGCFQGCCTEAQEHTTSIAKRGSSLAIADTTAKLDAAKVAKPGPSTSAITTQPQTSPSSSSSCSDSDSESKRSSFSEKEETGTGI